MNWPPLASGEISVNVGHAEYSAASTAAMKITRIQKVLPRRAKRSVSHAKTGPSSQVQSRRSSSMSASSSNAAATAQTLGGSSDRRGKFAGMALVSIGGEVRTFFPTSSSFPYSCRGCNWSIWRARFRPT